MNIKSNYVITGCVAVLVLLAVALIVMTVAPTTTQVAHTESTCYDWYFKPREDGKQPVVADNAPFIQNYDCIYLGDPEEKCIYLTFDVGYENGYTEKVLDALKEAKVPAAFFVTGHYIKSNPDLIRRMEEEGHLVCNHTMNHENLAEASAELFASEVNSLAEAYEEVTSKPMPKYLRPPSGRYSEKCLQMAQEMGYTMVFWSFAYQDWLNDDQPDPEASIQKIMSRTHPGEIVLLHSTSATNAEILPEVIKRWQDQGYQLKSLDDFPKNIKKERTQPSQSPGASPMAGVSSSTTEGNGTEGN